MARQEWEVRQMFIDNNVMKFACAICGPFGGLVELGSVGRPGFHG